MTSFGMPFKTVNNGGIPAGSWDGVISTGE